MVKKTKVKVKGSKKANELKYKKVPLPAWKPKAYTPETLWEVFKSYKQWITENPLKEDKGFAYQGIVTHDDFKKMRIMTVEGFAVHANITSATFYNYLKEPVYLYTCTRIKDLIDSNSVEGAAAGLLDAMIVVRKLGLSEKQELTGKDGKDLAPELVTSIKIIHVNR